MDLLKQKYLNYLLRNMSFLTNCKSELFAMIGLVLFWMIAKLKKVQRKLVVLPTSLFYFIRLTAAYQNCRKYSEAVFLQILPVFHYNVFHLCSKMKFCIYRTEFASKQKNKKFHKFCETCRKVNIASGGRFKTIQLHRPQSTMCVVMHP